VFVFSCSATSDFPDAFLCVLNRLRTERDFCLRNIITLPRADITRNRILRRRTGFQLFKLNGHFYAWLSNERNASFVLKCLLKFDVASFSLHKFSFSDGTIADKLLGIRINLLLFRRVLKFIYKSTRALSLFEVALLLAKSLVVIFTSHCILTESTINHHIGLFQRCSFSAETRKVCATEYAFGSLA